MNKISNLGLKSVKDLQKLDGNELKKELIDAKKRLFELKMKLELNELKQTHLIRYLRRYIAVIKTIARQKQLNI